MSRISIEVSPEEHKAIKALAALEGVPIKTLLWKPLEKKLRKHQAQMQGAGHPDCPLCREYAKNGRYNKRTEAVLKKSLEEIRTGKAKRFANVEDAIRDLRS